MRANLVSVEFGFNGDRQDDAGLQQGTSLRAVTDSVSCNHREMELCEVLVGQDSVFSASNSRDAIGRITG